MYEEIYVQKKFTYEDNLRTRGIYEGEEFTYNRNLRMGRIYVWKEFTFERNLSRGRNSRVKGIYIGKRIYLCCLLFFFNRLFPAKNQI